MTDQERQELLDDEHLKLLRIAYFVAGGSDTLFGLFPLLYVAMGLALIFGSFPSSGRPNEPGLPFVGAILVLFGSAVSLFFGIGAGLKFAAARAIGARRSRTLCFVAGAVSCMSMPWGTVLGVLTFIVLGRTSVREKFKPGAGTLLTPPEGLSSSPFSSPEGT